MKAQDLIEAINIIAKHVPLSEIKVWKEDHYMMGITNSETAKYSEADFKRLDELDFMKGCGDDCYGIICNCNPEYWTKFW